MTDKKVDLKVKYDKAKAKVAQPQMVTVWYIDRIVMAVALFIILVGLLIYALSNIESKNEVVVAEIKQSYPIEPEVNVSDIRPEQVVQVEEEKIEKRIIINSETKNKSHAEDNKASKTIALPRIFDQRVSRAILAKGLKNKEPVGEVSGPIMVDKTKAVGIYYFTEMNNMKGQVLFHKWFRNDKLVFKRKINILGNRWRTSTSKLLSYSAKGRWIVKLVDESENILSEIKFEVI